MPNHSIALITDSTCDLPQALREQYEIDVVPLSVIFGDEQLREGIDISAEAFYDRLVALQSVVRLEIDVLPGLPTGRCHCLDALSLWVDEADLGTVVVAYPYDGIHGSLDDSPHVEWFFYQECVDTLDDL